MFIKHGVTTNYSYCNCTRLRDYIDYAKRRNIYGKRPFAYYHGTNGFYDLHASDDEADRELFDELCQFIINNPLRAQRPTTDRK